MADPKPRFLSIEPKPAKITTAELMGALDGTTAPRFKTPAPAKISKEDLMRGLSPDGMQGVPRGAKPMAKGGRVTGFKGYGKAKKV